MKTSWSSSKLIALKKWVYQIISFAIVEMANSSTLVELVLTVFHLESFQSMTSLNSLSAYLWELWRMSRSLPNDASLLDGKTCQESNTHPSNPIEYILVLPRWSMIWLANFIWWFDGLVKNWHSLDASLTMTVWGITAVKLINLTLLVCKYPLRCNFFQQFYQLYKW